MHTVSENQCGKYALLLQQARTEAQADAATRFSSHLDAMIRHITKAELSGIKTASVTASDSVTATVPVVMVKASTRVTLDTPEVVCTNRLITGTLEVQKGGTMRGNIEHTGGELSSNGKVLHTHKHPGDSGGTTGGPL